MEDWVTATIGMILLITWGLGSVLCIVGAFLIWSNGDKIRNSRYWPMGFFGYLFLILMAAECYARSGLPM